MTAKTTKAVRLAPAETQDEFLERFRRAAKDESGDANAIVRCIENGSAALQIDDSSVDEITTLLSELPAPTRLVAYAAVFRLKGAPGKRGYLLPLQRRLTEKCRGRAKPILGDQLTLLPGRVLALDPEPFEAEFSRLASALSRENAESFVPEIGGFLLASESGPSTTLFALLLLSAVARNRPADVESHPAIEAAIEVLASMLQPTGKKRARSRTAASTARLALAVTTELKRDAARNREATANEKRLSDELRAATDARDAAIARVAEIETDSRMQAKKVVALETTITEMQLQQQRASEQSTDVRESEKRGLLATVQRSLRHELAGIEVGLEDDSSDRAESIRRRIANITRFLEQQAASLARKDPS